MSVSSSDVLATPERLAGRAVNRVQGFLRAREDDAEFRCLVETDVFVELGRP